MLTRAASLRNQDHQPYLHCKFNLDVHGNVEDVRAVQPKKNYKSEIVMSQFLEIVMHYLFRIVAKSAGQKFSRKTGRTIRKRTLTETANQYCATSQYHPEMDIKWRDLGLSSSYFSDFQFERLMSDPKRYVRVHGFFWNFDQLGRMERFKQQQLLRQAAGNDDTRAKKRWNAGSSRSTWRWHRGRDALQKVETNSPNINEFMK